MVYDDGCYVSTAPATSMSAPRADWLVVGAGFTGATLAERLASQANQRVLVVDRRPHLAGNAYDGPGNEGLHLHHYGAHIFHTSSEKVWTYLSTFTDWRPYEHRVLGDVDGVLVPIPFNLTSLHRLFPGRQAKAIERALRAEVGSDGRVPVLRLLEHPDPVLASFARYVHDAVFANYSAKQWGLQTEELDRSVTGRVPIVVSHDDRYFRDAHQGLPADGYVRLFERMLDHPNIEIRLGVEHRDVDADIRDGQTIFTGPIDEYFDHCFGSLPYRSLRFHHSIVPVGRALPAAVVNYPAAPGFTRLLEHTQLTGEVSSRTVITSEWPEEYVAGRNEPYYPIPRPESRALHHRYRVLAVTKAPNVVFAGRLADYRYYNMDQAVSRALLVFRSLASGRSAESVPALALAR